MNLSPLQLQGVKTVAGAIAVLVLGIGIYLVAVLNVYILAWILGLIGIIFN